MSTLSFLKKAKAAQPPATPPSSAEAPAPKSEAKSVAQAAPHANGGAGSGGSNKPSWMLTGKKAHTAIEAADAKAELAREQANKMFRFWMPPGEDRKITFLDGLLDDEGMLDVPMWYEHKVKVAGDYETFVCVADSEPCPICEAGEKQTLVGVMTIIDHTPHKIKQGPNAGKVIVNSRKLFVCTRTTIKILAKKAVKQGGLAGCTFEVSRTGEKDASVGNQFEFEEKRTLAQLAKALDLKIEDVQPADYEKEITRRSAEELTALGLGKSTKGIGHEKGVNKAALKSEL